MPSIRKSKTRGNEYYVYDLPTDIFGKRKRLYGKTEEEVKRKIKEYEEHREMLKNQFPEGSRLKDFVLHYFRNSAAGSISGTRTMQLVNLFENAVFDSSIDRDMNELTAEEIQDFYKTLLKRYAVDTVKDIDIVMGNVFEMARSAGRTDFDYTSVVFPEQEEAAVCPEYYASAEELDKLLEFCLMDNCRKYKANELFLTFVLLTGLAFTDVKKIPCKDVDLSVPQLVTNGRVFPLDKRTAEWLKKMDGEEKLHISNYSEGEMLFNDTANFRVTMDLILNQCGLPKGISRKSLHQACIVRLLENGAQPSELYKKYGYKNAAAITAIYDEYRVNKKLF